MTCFMSYDWFLVCCAVDSEESSDGSRTMTHYESWVYVTWSMRHTGLGLGEGPYIKGGPWLPRSFTNHLSYTSGDWNLNTMGNHRHFSTTTHSQWAALYLLPSPLFCLWLKGLFPRSRCFASVIFSSRSHRFASTSAFALPRLASATVGNTSLRRPRGLPCDCHLPPGP